MSISVGRRAAGERDDCSRDELRSVVGRDKDQRAVDLCSTGVRSLYSSSSSDNDVDE